ncbi:MAG: hypothetical protein ACRDZO_12015 [Egibacteraceae bacterium]
MQREFLRGNGLGSRRLRLWVISACLVALSLSGACAESATALADATFPITFENCGRQVTVSEPVERVLPIDDAVGLVYAAAGADMMVARADEGDFRSALQLA